MQADAPDLATGLIRLARLVNDVFAQTAAAHGLTATQARLLCILIQRPRGMAELAGLLGIDKAGMTGLVDRIERQDLAERAAVPGDRRAVRVRLTPAGRTAAVAVHDRVCASLETMATVLPPADRERFRLAVALVTAGEGAPGSERAGGLATRGTR